MTLESEGRVLLHFAVAYGFRNIQNLVQKLKRGRCPYHYVEVMACPSGSHSRPTLHRLHGDQCRRQHPAGQGGGGMWGPYSWHVNTFPIPHPHPSHSATGCLNGGGQLKAPDTSSKELLQHVERLYSMVRTEEPEDVPGVQELYRDWLHGEGSEQASCLLHTSYHAVEKASSGHSIRW